MFNDGLIFSVRSRTRKKKLEETVCPVCNKRVSGTPEELNEHVELCLKRVGCSGISFKLASFKLKKKTGNYLIEQFIYFTVEG